MTRSTSVRFASHRVRSRTAAKLVPLGLAAAIACAPVTSAFAQGAQGTQSSSRATTQATAQATTQSERQATPGRLIVPVTISVGAEANGAAAAPVSGTFSVQRFARSETGVAAVGTLTVSITDPQSSTLRTIVTRIAAPIVRPGTDATAADTPVGQAPSVVATSETACTTLNLALGAVDVQVLGQTVHVERTPIDVTAVQGSNQLGTLLCQIAGLLDSETASAQLVSALNRLLDMLG
jgi:hypothetical protein